MHNAPPRQYTLEGPKRRWVTGSSGELPLGAERLLQHGLGRLRKWQSAGRAAGRGIDQVAAEHLLWAMVDAGMVKVHQRRNRRGDWESYQWTLTQAGERHVAQIEIARPDVAAYLAGDDPQTNEVLQAIRQWLEADASEAEAVLVAIVVAMGEQLRLGKMPRGRLISIVIAGDTKTVRVDEHRDAIEDALGLPLESMVRLHGQAVLAYGAFDFMVGERRIDGDWSRPWLALTPDTLESLTDLRVHARRLLTIENLVAFEEEVRRGLPMGTVAVYTGGFPTHLERSFLQRLVESGIDHVDHWSDLDVGGLRIFRHLDDILPVPVRPFRMEPELLDRLPTRPLTQNDRAALQAWLDEPLAPLQPLAGAILERGAKVEQEAWFLYESPA